MLLGAFLSRSGSLPDDLMPERKIITDHAIDLVRSFHSFLDVAADRCARSFLDVAVDQCALGHVVEIQIQLGTCFDTLTSAEDLVDWALLT